MGRVFEITVELLSAVSPTASSKYLLAFANAICSALEASGMWKEAPPASPIVIPSHIVDTPSACKVKRSVQAARKAVVGKVLIDINMTHPHKSFRLSPIGRHNWKLEFYSHNLKLKKQDVLDALSDVSVRDATHAVILCEVASIRHNQMESINISSPLLLCGKPPRPDEITLDVEEFRRDPEGYKEKHRQIMYRQSRRQTRKAEETRKSEK